MDIRQTSSYAQYLQKINWTVKTYNNNQYFIKKIPFLGSFIKLQRPDNFSVSDIKTIEKKFHPTAFIIEPIDESIDLIPLGFTQRSPYVPSKTIVIDLTKTEEQLLSECKKHTRQALKKTATKEITITNDFPLFRKKWIEASQGKRYIPNEQKFLDFIQSFSDNCVALMDQDGNAGAVIIASNDTAYYWHGFTNEKGRKDMTQYKVLWEAFRWAKKNKKKTFDMEGIYDTRFPIKGWEGFSHFKKSFGGVERAYPGAFIKYYGLMKYLRIF